VKRAEGSGNRGLDIECLPCQCDKAKNGVPVVNDISPHGLHHVTAIASDPQRNVDFYTGVLGLRLVKQTVNFDAPDTYHLYYGNQQGHPSTLLTFFRGGAFRRASRARG
jgi:Glyoxalase/Bleomycin resistance protein/Dioxygenase superfamily